MRTTRQFQAAWHDVKQENKQRLTALAASDLRHRRQCRLDVRRHGQATARVQTPTAQGAAHHLALPSRQGESPDAVAVPHVRLRRKAAPGYVMAKRIIKLIHNLARVVNDDPDVNGRLTMCSFPPTSM